MEFRSFLVQDDAGLTRIFRDVRTIAVLGAKAGAASRRSTYRPI
jgi:hypothetical protein